MKKKDKKLIFWGLGGLAALYFLTRPKTAPAPPVPTAQQNAGSPASYLPLRRASGRSIGLPYTYNAEI